MKFNVERKMLAGMITVLLLMAGIGLVSYLSIKQLVENTQNASDSLVVRRGAVAMLTIMLNLETGTRGYVITGEELYMDPYRKAVAEIDRQMAALSRNIENAPEQRQRFSRLEKLVAAKMAIENHSIELRKTQGFEAALADFQRDDGLHEMDQIREVLGSIIADQDQLMAQQNLRGEHQSRQTIWTIGIGSAFGFLFVAASCVLIHRDLVKRREAEEQLDNFFTLALDMLCIAGTNGYFQRLNPVWQNILGYSEAELLSKPFIDFVHPDDRIATIAATQQISDVGFIARFENRYLCQDGSYRWLMWMATISGDRQRIFASARDITNEKRAEAEIAALNETLRKHNEQLEITNNELEAFSYSVSHDLRAPLRGLDGFSQALLEDCADKLNPEDQDNLRRIRSASQRMGHLIDDLLNLSRLTRTEMKHEQVDLSAMAHQIVDELHESDPRREVDCVIADKLVVDGDPRLLQIALTNLLSNAWKFTSKQSHSHIELGCKIEDGNKTFFVRDDGVGFDMAFAQNLFGAFQRLHSMQEFPGTGIGLATVQRIFRRHHGRVWADSALDAGATFYFTL